VGSSLLGDAVETEPGPDAGRVVVGAGRGAAEAAGGAAGRAPIPASHIWHVIIIIMMMMMMIKIYIVTVIITITSLSSSWWARYVQDIWHVTSVKLCFC